jgi:hypothetical protein
VGTARPRNEVLGTVRCVTVVGLWAFSWETTIVAAKAVFRARRDLCSPVQRAWRTVEDTKAAEIYGLNAGLARRVLAGEQSGLSKGWVRARRGRKGEGGARGRKVCAVYNSIAATEMVGICYGRRWFLFCLLQENRFNNWTWDVGDGLLKSGGSPGGFGGLIIGWWGTLCAVPRRLWS